MPTSHPFATGGLDGVAREKHVQNNQKPGYVTNAGERDGKSTDDSPGVTDDSPRAVINRGGFSRI